MRSRLLSAGFLALIAAGFVLWTKFRKPDTWVTLDNNGDSAITVSIDGKDLGPIAAHSHKRLSDIKTGKYEIVAKDPSGSIIEKADFSVVAEPRGGKDSCFVYNLTGKARYAVANVQYAKIPSAPTRTEVGANAKFFKVDTREIDCEIDKTIPQEVTVKGNSSVTKFFLCHLDEDGNVKCPGW